MGSIGYVTLVDDMSHFQLTHLPPGQDGRHFTDDIFRCIFVNEKFCILTKIWLKFVSKGIIEYPPLV